MTDANLSFSIVQKRSFREMICRFARRDVYIPSTSFFMSAMNESYNTMITKMKTTINRVEYVCVTCDVWSSRAQSYLGMTLHYIESDFSRKSLLLAFTQLQGRQTYQELACEMFAVFKKFEIPNGKITNIVTDGGSAFCKAFKIFGQNADPHCEPIVPQTIEEEDEENETSFDTRTTDSLEQSINSMKDMPFMQYNDGENFFSNVITLDGDAHGVEEYVNNVINESAEGPDNNENTNSYRFDVFDENDMDYENYGTSPSTHQALPKQRRCLSHLLNLTASDFQKNLSCSLKFLFHSTLAKLHTIWVFPRRSALAKTIASDVLGKQLKCPCETRWNSLYDAVSCIFEMKLEKINAFIDVIKEKIKSVSHMQRLSNEDWVVIVAYLKVMGPVAKSLDVLQGEISIGQGYILPTLLSIKTRISGLKGGNVVSGFRDVMLGVIEKRFANYMTIGESNRDLLIASITTPLFKHTFLESDVERIIAEDILMSESLLSATNTPIEEVVHDQVGNINDGFFILYPSNRTMRRQSLEKSIEEEILRYLCDVRIELEMLNDFPMIKRIYLKHNTTLPSSAAVERIFSQSKLIFTHLRNRILGTNFEKALMLKINSKL